MQSHNAPYLISDAFDSICMSGLLRTRLFPFHLVNCSFHQVSSSLATSDKGQGTSYIWSLSSRTATRFLWSTLQNRGPRGIAWRSELSFPSRRDTSQAVGGACLSTILVASSLICFNFCPGTRSSMHGERVDLHCQKLYLLSGVVMDFTGRIIKPRFSKR